MRLIQLTEKHFFTTQVLFLDIAMSINNCYSTPSDLFIRFLSIFLLMYIVLT